MYAIVIPSAEVLDASMPEVPTKLIGLEGMSIDEWEKAISHRSYKLRRRIAESKARSAMTRKELFLYDLKGIMISLFL